MYMKEGRHHKGSLKMAELNEYLVKRFRPHPSRAADIYVTVLLKEELYSSLVQFMLMNSAFFFEIWYPVPFKKLHRCCSPHPSFVMCPLCVCDHKTICRGTMTSQCNIRVLGVQIHAQLHCLLGEPG